jgi:hypothetical protein
MSAHHKRDWQKTRIHACFGFILGGATALVSGGSWVAVLAWALVVGLAAGIFLDEFWDNLRSWWP